VLDGEHVQPAGRSTRHGNGTACGSDDSMCWDVGASCRAGQCVEGLRIAAEQGQAEAQFQLAERYSADADGPDAAQMAKAAAWYLRAAAQGHADAEVSLGQMYEAGSGGLTVNPAEAKRLYLLAAHQQNAAGQFNLGRMLATGDTEDIAADKEDFIMWFRRAAEQGHADAQAFLGLMYQSGMLDWSGGWQATATAAGADDKQTAYAWCVSSFSAVLLCTPIRSFAHHL
jgi:TPR repeat protein